jgi:DNA-binding HxlR family transcriptional regulator
MIKPSPPPRTEWVARSPTKRTGQDTPLGLRIGVLGKKWTLLILRHVAAEGRPSFSHLLRSHPQLSRRILSMRLKELQREGYLEKIITHGNPRRTAYVLTDKGRDALPILYAFSELVRRYGEGVNVARGQSVRVEDLCFAHPDIPDTPQRPVDLSPFPMRPPVRPRVELVMYKDRCEKCKTALAPDSEAYVCSYACTWCRPCTEGFHWRCPNCQGALHPRPRLGKDDPLPPSFSNFRSR